LVGKTVGSKYPFCIEKRVFFSPAKKFLTFTKLKKKKKKEKKRKKLLGLSTSSSVFSP
jgi:hypothetical protein